MFEKSDENITHPRYASVIFQRYVDAMGATDVFILRDGQKLTLEEIISQ